MNRLIAVLCLAMVCSWAVAGEETTVEKAKNEKPIGRISNFKRN